MRIGKFDLDQKVLVIAEIGNNHEGDFALAEEMVSRAVAAGADAVKFQTFIPELYVSSQDAERLARLKRFQFSFDQFANLAKSVERAGAIFLSTPFDLESLSFLATICSALKISSGDNTFYPLLSTAGETGKPLILSTGLTDLSLLQRAVGTIEQAWRQTGHPGELALLQCTVSYPAPVEQANLRAITTLAREFPYTVGYSDHTLGIQAAPLSVTAGARVVEKHFTLDKNYSDFRDHQLSANPADFAEMVARIREAESMLGSGIKEVQPAELPNRNAARRSLAAARNMAEGEAIAESDLICIRPGTGIAPGEEATLIGRRLRRALSRGELIMPGDASNE